MYDTFELASRDLEGANDSPDGQREVMVQLASDALSEHAQWVVLHRRCPFEFEAGG